MAMEFHTQVKVLVPPTDDEHIATKEYVDTHGPTGAAMPEPPDDDKLYARSRATGATAGTWEEISGIEIDDATPSATTVFSSNKTLAEIDALLDDSATGATSTTWSSHKIVTEIDAAALSGATGPTGPTGATGETGETGPAGTSVTIAGSFPTLAALQAAHPSGTGNLSDG